MPISNYLPLFRPKDIVMFRQDPSPQKAIQILRYIIDYSFRENMCFDLYEYLKPFIDLIDELKIVLDLSFDNEHLFRYACYSKNLKCVKYLMSINKSINVRASFDSAFKNACWLNDLPMINYLISLQPYTYKYIPNYDKCFIIYDTEEEQRENKWNQKRLYMTLKEKKQPINNIIYNVPSDISRYIMEFIFY